MQSRFTNSICNLPSIDSTVEPRVSGHTAPVTRDSKKIAIHICEIFSLGSTQHKFYGSSDILAHYYTISHITSTCTGRQSQRYNTTDYVSSITDNTNQLKHKWHGKISINGVPRYAGVVVRKNIKLSTFRPDKRGSTVIQM